MNDIGNKQIRELINHRDDQLFTLEERQFIRELFGVDFANLDCDARSKIKRLYLWFKIKQIKTPA